MLTKNTNLLTILNKEGILIPGRALDLGCGKGEDTKALADLGFTVDAVDKEPVPFENTDKITSFYCDIRNFPIEPDTYTFVNAQLCLQFVSKDEARTIIEKMVKGAKNGGIIAFNLIGSDDDWSEGKGWSTWGALEANQYIKSLPIKFHKISEEYGKGLTYAGTMKYWHIFNFVFIKQ